MRILGIDTATSTATVALVEQGRALAEAQFPAQGVHPSVSRSNHVEVLLPLIDSVLRRAGIHISDIAGVAVSIGPGSFTGIRIGLSTAKGLVYGTSVPAIGVSTLQANAARAPAFDGFICSILDAGNKEVYAALFEKTGSVMSRVTQDVLIATTKVFQKIADVTNHSPCLFLGDGVRLLQQSLKTWTGGKAEIASEESLPPLATALACIGEQTFGHQREDTALAQLAPVYLRRPHYELALESRLSS
jgi:tRNA threonylcarbamoyladenosine biosynthesis protein TsaB